jgi:hypothetical protein
MSSDTWAAVAIYGRNLLLNWMILFPALWLMILFPKIASAALQLARANPLPEYANWLFGAFIGSLVVLSTWYTNANRVSDRSVRLYKFNAQSTFLLADLLPLVVAGTGLTWAVNRPQAYLGWLTAVYGQVFALVAIAAAVLYAAGFVLALLTRKAATAENRGPPVQWFRDGAAWIVSGIVAGEIIWLGTSAYVHSIPDEISLTVWQCSGDCSSSNASAVPITLDAKSLLVVLGTPYFLVAVIVGQLAFVMLRSYSPRGDIEREWLGRAAGWYVVVALGWIIGSTLVLFASGAAAGASLVGTGLENWLAPLGGISGAVAALLGRSSTTPAHGPAPGWLATATNVGLSIASAAFGAVIVISFSIAIDQIIFGQPLQKTLLFHYDVANADQDSVYAEQWATLLGATVGLLVAWLFSAWLINPNRFSLHALYRNRLIRAFLGGPHLAAPEPSQRRRPNLFTGFDNTDNPRLADLWPQGRSPGDWRPFQVINIALNVVSGRNLAWQQRKAEPFIATPLACGSHGCGYRPTHEYGNQGDRGISLGTAMAVSGAAASPNMGYHSSPLVTLLLAVLNVRLGWWLGNPGPPGDRTYGYDGPKLAFGPFFAELFGLTTNTRAYVYLSDGGHFENLGLYEMIRRRCAVIVVSDAGQDGEYDFADLGNAVRKIRIDLGVELSFPALETFRQPNPAPPGWQRPVFMIGTANYPEPDSRPCKIFYMKPGLRGGEPADILAYAREYATFPHQTTNDQWFDEPQFESYRALGHHTMTSVVNELTAMLAEIEAQAATHS